MASGGLLSLKWNNHCSTFLHILAALHKKQTYDDATVACDGKFYPVHKLVLSTCSDYFEEMFNKTHGKHPVIVLKDIKSDVFEALLEYMYIGEVNVIQEKLSDLINAAECLKIKGLAAPDEEPAQNYRSKFSGSAGGGSSAKRKQDYISSDNNPPSKIHRSHSGSSSNISHNQSSNNNNSISKAYNNSNAVCNSRSPSSSRYPRSTETSREKQDTPMKRTHPRVGNTEDDYIEELPVVVKTEPGDVESCVVDDADGIDEGAVGVDGGELQEEEEPDSKFGILKGGEEEDDPWSSALMPKEDEGGEEYSYDNSSSTGDTGQGQPGDSNSAGVRSKEPLQQLGSFSKYESSLLSEASTSSYQFWELYSSFPQQNWQAPPSSEGKQLQSIVTTVNQFAEYSNSGDAAFGSTEAVGGSFPVDNRRSNAKDLGDLSIPVHKCPHCDYATVVKHNYDRHQRRHTGERPFGCPYCIYRSTTKQNVLSHMNSKHSDKAVDGSLVLISQANMVEGCLVLTSQANT